MFKRSFLATLMIGFCCSASCSAAEGPDRHVPPSQWTDDPVWSHNGKFVGVTWPAPPVVYSDGHVEYVPGSRQQKSAEQRLPNSKPATRSAPATATGMLSNYDEQRVLLLDTKSFMPLPFSFKGNFGHSIWSPNDKMIAIGSSIYSTMTGKPVIENVSTGNLNTFAWSSNSNKFAVGMRHGFDVWQVDPVKKLFSTQDFEGECISISWHSAGHRVAVVSSSAGNLVNITSATVYDVDSGKKLLNLKCKSGVGGAAWSSNGKWLACGDDTIHIYDAQSLAKIVEFDSKIDDIDTNFHWSPDGNYLAYIAPDAKLKIFNLQTMKMQSEISAEKTGQFRFTWSPDNVHILIEDSMESIAICDAMSGTYLGSVKQIPNAMPAKWAENGKSLCISGVGMDRVKIIPITYPPAPNLCEGSILGNPWAKQVVLRDIDDCFAAMDKLFSPEHVKSMKEVTGDELWKLTSVGGPGMWLRNAWLLGRRNPISDYFRNLGIKDRRDMSDVIIVAYWRRLNNQPIDFKGLVEAHVQQASKHLEEAKAREKNANPN